VSLGALEIGSSKMPDPATKFQPMMAISLSLSRDRSTTESDTKTCWKDHKTSETPWRIMLAKNTSSPFLEGFLEPHVWERQMAIWLACIPSAFTDMYEQSTKSTTSRLQEPW